MNGPVDVLAVLDSLLISYDNDSVCRARIHTRDELRKARAAVAELIEAAKIAQKSLLIAERAAAKSRGDRKQMYRDGRESIDTALARVGGAS